MPRIQITKPDGYLGNPHGSVHTVTDDDATTLYQLVVSAARLPPEQRKAAIDLLPGTTGGYLVPATLADDVLHALVPKNNKSKTSKKESPDKSTL